MTNIDFNTPTQLLLYGGLLIVLAICSVTDLTQRRIPNLLTGPTMLAALLAYGLLGGMEGLLFSLRGLAFGLAVFLAPYLLGGMGAGDVKLMGGVGAVLGPAHTFIAILFIAIAGGCMALGMMLYRGTLRQTLSKICMSLLFLGAHQDASLLRVDKNARPQDGIPYALAITSGVCLFFIYLLITKETLPVFAVG
jgi:prepilin peptidase CpaA